MTKQKISLRGFQEALEGVRTIADPDRSAELMRYKILEALTYRGMLLTGPLPG